MEIKRKKENFELLKKGFFGNKLKIWSSVDEILEDSYSGTVSMRYNGGSKGFFYAYDVPINKITEVEEKWIKEGAKKELIVFNENAPDNFLTIQGELMIDYELYCLFYSTEKKKMNEAMKNGKHATCLTAKLILEHFLDPSSCSDIQALLDIFPDRVIEFSTYSIYLGDIPGRNTIIWDVRNC